MSVVRWAVTAMTRPDGTAASATQRACSAQVPLSACAASSAEAGAGARCATTTAAQAISAASTAKPPDQSWVCVLSDSTGSSSSGYAISAANEPRLEAAYSTY